MAFLKNAFPQVKGEEGYLEGSYSRCRGKGGREGTAKNLGVKLSNSVWPKKREYMREWLRRRISKSGLVQIRKGPQ